MDALTASGFHSLYHHTTSEQQGEEMLPTFFLQRKEEKPFHIDYVFAHEKRLDEKRWSAQVGSPSEWLSMSDHMPIIVDL